MTKAPRITEVSERLPDGTYATDFEDRGERPTQEFDVVRIVCGPCNSGWMSRLERQVKPILTIMQSMDRDIELSDTQLSALSRWAFKTAAMREHTNPSSVAITTNQVQQIRAGAMPENSLVFLSTLHPDVEPHISHAHTASHVVEPEDGADVGVVGPPWTFNMETTTMVLGRVILQVRSLSDDPGAALSSTLSAKGAPGIVNIVGMKSLRWPILQAVGQRRLDALERMQIDGMQS